ncbi:MAG: IS110 family transposase, partial [Shewanella fodinae]|nr:IS110 family transposase [Shewanella fodinae]
ERRGKMKATVALANKLTRIVWRLLTEPTVFNINKAFAMC